MTVKPRESADCVDDVCNHKDCDCNCMTAKEKRFYERYKNLESKLSSAEKVIEECEKALAMWMKVESEMKENHPCPDLALRASYRKQSIFLTNDCLASIKSMKEGGETMKPKRPARIVLGECYPIPFEMWKTKSQVRFLNPNGGEDSINTDLSIPPGKYRLILEPIPSGGKK